MQPDHTYFDISINPLHSNPDLSVLFSGEGKPNPQHKMGPAVHDYYLMHTVLSGKGTFEMGQRTYACSTGDTFIIYPGELFSYTADSTTPWHYVWVASNGRSVDSLLSQIGVSPQQAVVSGNDPRTIRHFYRHLRACFTQTSFPQLEELEAEGWLRLLLRELGRVNTHHISAKPAAETDIQRQIGQAIRYLELQYTQAVSIEHLARSLGYHRTYLCKMFKQSTGLSPMQYLFNIRMERAKQLLMTTAMTIDQVASSVGFNDALYFSKQFHKWSGSAPSVYRKELRQLP
jgi:AraC-like DNA-binding protein